MEGSDAQDDIRNTATETVESTCASSSPQSTSAPQENDSPGECEMAANVGSPEHTSQASTEAQVVSEPEVEPLGCRLEDFPAPGKESLLVVRAVARLCSFLVRFKSYFTLLFVQDYVSAC